MQHIQLNIIPFTPVIDKLTFAFYSEKIPNYVSIKWDKLFEEFPEGREAHLKSYYCDFQEPRVDAIIKEIDVYNAIKFTQHYYRYQIINHFTAIVGAIVFPNFTDDVEIWIEDKNFQHKVYSTYNKFTIKIQYKCVSAGYELVLAYNGTSRIMKQSIEELPDADSHLYNLINCNGTIYKDDKMPEDIRQHRETLFPIIGYDLNQDLLQRQIIAKEETVIENRYPIFYNHLEVFYKTYLKTKEFNNLFVLSENGFYRVPENNVYLTSENSNELQFLKGTHINPGMGIIEHKPLLSYTATHVKLLFIYHTNDGKLIRETLFEYIKNGWHKEVNGTMKHTKNLERYINQTLSIAKDKRIVFKDENTILEEVKDQLKDFVAEPNTKYAAIYISPISKLDKEHPQHNAYYKIKEQLLNMGITSQVIYKDNLRKEEFYYFLSNIYVALLAKIGGIPWRLVSDKTDEIIIGIGAFKPKGAALRFLGSAFCFSNAGVFENFDCFRDDDTKMLAGSIRNAVELFLEKKPDAKRVIIHFYKEISDRKELQPILDMLGTLGKNDLPVIVVTINKTDSRELLGFDLNNWKGKMPVSGTYLKVGPNRFLLFNSIRYFENSVLKDKDYHFPIKLSLKSRDTKLLEDKQVVSELIDQVYQFSRMYWKSISQQNLPVTTKYPEMVAEIFPHFEQDKLPDFGKENLWFL